MPARRKISLKRQRRLLSYAVAETIIAPERAAALAGVSTAGFMRKLGQIF